MILNIRLRRTWELRNARNCPEHFRDVRNKFGGASKTIVAMTIEMRKKHLLPIVEFSYFLRTLNEKTSTFPWSLVSANLINSIQQNLGQKSVFL